MSPASFTDSTKENSSINLHIISKTNRQTESLHLPKQKHLVCEYFKLLSLAHECVREQSGDNVFYSGPSPDEVTLVEFAKESGYEFVLGND